MWRRLWIMLATGTALTGAYLGYSALFTPTIRVRMPAAELISTDQSSESLRPTETLRIAELWLSHRPWAAQAQKTLWTSTKEMFLFADEWTPRAEQGQVRFRPFAGVWISKNKHGEEEAFTVTAESALLKFESKFDLDNPRPGRITGGALEGEVEIHGPDGLKIAGENFFFAEGTSSIYSPKGNSQPVKFEFGENRGTAGGMRIALIKADRPISKDRPNVIGVEAVELFQNPQMTLKMDEDPKSQPVNVKCTESFKYDVESQTGVFDKNVLAYQKQSKESASPSESDPAATPEKQRNARPETHSLRCDRLTVRFEPKPGASNTANPPAVPKADQEFRQIERNLQFRSMKAEGARVLIASGQDLKAMMTLLTYDAASRTIEMSAPATTEASSPKDVVVKRGKDHLQCPHVRLVLGPDNSLAEAVCTGDGWLETFDEKTGDIAFAADWLKLLRKSTDPETQLDLVELHEDASFRQPTRDTGLVADVIRLWFTPMEKGQSDQPTIRFGGGSGSPDPKRLLAVKRVALVSPQLEADTDQLEVLFEEVPDVASPKDQSLSRRSRNPLRMTSGKNAASVAAQTVDLASATSEKDDEENETPNPPMMIAADKIRVRMLTPESTDATPEVREIWTIGRVKVEQPSAKGEGSLVVTGAKLHVENHSETDQVVHVYGEPNRPAHIRDEQQQLHIEGELIHFDRAENNTWVDGAGLLQMPVKESLEGQALDTPQLMDVWWRESMDFDGLLATFDGDVRVKLAEVRMECQSMQVALASKVLFTEPQSSAEPPKLESITCRNGVKFENRQYLDNRLMEIQIGKAFELFVDHSKQTAQAKGPGWIQMWQRRKSTRAGLAAANSVKSNTTKHEPTTEWEYTRVDFFGRMDGQIAERRTTLHDRVEVLSGPVLKPMDEFDQHNIPKGGAAMTCKELQVLRTAPDQDGNAYLKLLGAGDTKLEGHGFYGRADQISYDETKGLFILNSIGRRHASIWKVHPKGDQHAKEMHFVPSTGQIKVIQAIGGSGTQ